jgi:hypothetical protein
MLKRIRERVGSAGLIVAIMALVLAVAGGAYAAGGGLSAKQKKEVEKISKKFAGKPGAQGAPGASGKDGSNGTNGATGKDGVAGAAGKSVKVTAASPLQCNELGGVVVEREAEPASAKEVCNGEEGSPWTAGGTLPAGATETGSWVFINNESAEKEVYVALSFPIKLLTTLSASKVHFESEANFSDFDEAGSETIGCEGTTAEPKAPKGNLCVYGNVNVFNASFAAIRNIGNGSSAASLAGALLVFERVGAGEAFGSGSFAVTGS